MFTAIIGWFSSNIKWVVIGLAVVALSTMGLKLYNTIKQNGQYEIQISVLEASAKNKDKIIKALEMDSRLVQETLVDRDLQIKALDEKLENVTDNLGKDENDGAADTLKELFRRLNK